MSNLASKIRSCSESDQFDLANYTESRVNELVTASFTEPFKGSYPVMISFKFIVGGGKLVRSKYDDALPKWMTQSLKNIGFTDDSSAAETFDSQAKFKFQHDTGQNLKFIIVFPKFDIIQTKQQATSQSTLSNTPDDLIRSADVSLFQEMVQSKTFTWKSRKHVVELLKVMQTAYLALEQKMIQGETLTEQEKTSYETTNDAFDLKIQFMQDLIKLQIENKIISDTEKTEILKQLESNISSTTDSQKLANLTKRKEMISSIVPKDYKLVNHVDIIKLHVKILELNALEDKRRQGILTITELATLEKKPEYVSDIHHLEQQSRGWYLEDADFEAMCKSAELEAAKVFKTRSKKPNPQSKSTSKSSSSASSSSVFQFSKNSVKSALIGQKTAAKKTGFSAAFGDDSDDD